VGGKGGAVIFNAEHPRRQTSSFIGEETLRRRGLRGILRKCQAASYGIEAFLVNARGGGQTVAGEE
jgi:hypothetical protein